MGGKTQTSTSSVQIPPEVLARYNAVNARAEQVAGTPFQAYSSNPNAFVAPMTATQNQAIGQIANASTMAQPYFQTGAAATMAGMGPANLGELDTQKYMSPYLQNVVQNTADIIGQQNQQAMSGALGSAIGAGAGWGDRSGIAAANLARQQQMGLGSTIGNLLNQGYMQAQGVAQQQQSADLAARQANLARLMQGGQGLGQLGAGAQGAALAGGQALLGAGTQEQQTNQAGLSALYNQFLQERAYPFQVAQFLGNLAMGTGALSGSTTTTTSPAGFFSGFKKGGKVDGYRRGGLVPESMGGHVASEHMGEGYADGGMPMDYSTMVMQQLFGGTDPSAGAYGLNKMGLGAGSYIPKADLPVGQLMIADPVQAPTQTNASDIVDMASSLGDTAEKAGAIWDKYGPKASPFDVKDEDTIYGKIGNARGGRTGLAAGGMPYDPESTGYVPDNTPGKPPELLQPKAPDQPESGLGKVADIAKLAMMFMGMNRGGSTYAEGGHVVERGDTLTGIARKYGRSLEDILSANPELRKNPDLIQIGQRVMLPQDRQAAGTPFPPKPSDFPARPGLAGAMPAARFEAQGVRPGVVGSMPRTDVALPANYEFPTAGFGQERYPGSYMSGTGQKNLMDLLKLEAMRREGNYASGGVAGRSGYLDGGFASDAALADLARKKREQDILNELGSSQWTGLGAANPADGGNSDAAMAELARQRLVWQSRHQDRERSILDELRSSDWSGGLGAANPAATQPASSTPPAPPPAGGLAAGQAALAATGETAPSPLTYRADLSPFERQAADISVNEAMKHIGSGIASRYPDLGPLNFIGDMMLKPSEMQTVNAQRAERKAMEDWYNSQRDYFAQNPNELALAKADPVAYYQKGIVPAATGITTSGLSPAQMPPAPAPVTSDAELPATVQQPGLVPPIPRAREDRPGISPEEKRSLTPTAAGTAELGPTTEKYKGDDFFGEHIIPRESAGRHFDKNGNPLTSSAGAIGISQMLPSTGPEAARLAGLEWDENRFYNDPKYNEKLGRAYFNSLLERYNGDTTLAAAAYNAGMGRVDKAIARARENGGNWTDYLPGETRKYIAGMPGGTVEPGSVTAGGAGSPGGLGNANIWDQITGKAPGGENIILPFLVGLGKMAGSQSRFLGTALLEGIGGGAEAYMKRQEQLANIGMTQATTRGIDVDNVRKSFQETQWGNIMWTSQNGVPVPMTAGEYYNLMSEGKYLPPLGFVPTNSTELLKDYFAKIGAPVIQTGAEAGAGTGAATESGTPATASTGFMTPEIEAAARREQTNVMSGGQGAADVQERSKAFSQEATTGASSARETYLQRMELGKALTESIKAKGLDAPGFAFDQRAQIGSIVNGFARAFNLAPIGEDVFQGENIQNIVNKISTLQGALQAQIGGQEAVGALEALKGAVANPNMSAVAFSRIYADNMAQMQRLIDRANFRDAYGKISNGYYGDAAQQFENARKGSDYRQESSALSDTMMRDPDAFEMALSGAPAEEIDKYFLDIYGIPDMSRYFVGGR